MPLSLGSEREFFFWFKMEALSIQINHHQVFEHMSTSSTKQLIEYFFTISTAFCDIVPLRHTSHQTPLQHNLTKTHHFYPCNLSCSALRISGTSSSIDPLVGFHPKSYSPSPPSPSNSTPQLIASNPACSSAFSIPKGLSSNSPFTSHRQQCSRLRQCWVTSAMDFLGGIERRLITQEDFRCRSVNLVFESLCHTGFSSYIESLFERYTQTVIANDVA